MKSGAKILSAIIVTLIALSPFINSLEVECDYGYPYDWVIIGKVLTCTISNINVLDRKENVTKVTGILPIDESVNETANALTMNDVKLVNIVRSRCHFFPSGFEKFFPNLEGIRVGGSGLTELTHENLKNFPKLRYVDAWHNNVDMLSSDLFTSTPNIEYLYFGDNDIKYIGTNTFTPIKNLSVAVFQSNDCIDKNFHSLAEVQELIKMAHLRCVPNDEIVDKGFCDAKVVQLIDENKKFKMRAEELTNAIERTGREFYTLRHQNALINSEKIELGAKVKELEGKISQMKGSDSSNDVAIEAKTQKLEEENEKLRDEIRKLKEEKEENGSSENWIWITILMAIVFVGCAVGYLYYNRMFLFKSDAMDERLT